MKKRAEAFVNRIAEQSDNFRAKVAKSAAALELDDRQGLKQLTSALKDVSAVDRDTYGLSTNEGAAQCIVNLGVLRDYVPELVEPPDRREN
jgi:hypothetical protein